MSTHHTLHTATTLFDCDAERLARQSVLELLERPGHQDEEDVALPGTLRSFHANDGETSVYLAHSPELVTLALAVDEPVDYERPVFSYHSRQITQSGCIGRPRAATAEKGRAILAWAIEDLAAVIEQAAKEPMPPDVWGVRPP